MTKWTSVVVAIVTVQAQAQEVQYVEKAPAHCELLETEKFEGGLNPSRIKKRQQISHASEIGATHIERLTTHIGVGQSCLAGVGCEPAGIYLVELRYLSCPASPPEAEYAPYNSFSLVTGLHWETTEHGSSLAVELFSPNGGESLSECLARKAQTVAAAQTEELRSELQKGMICIDIGKSTVWQMVDLLRDQRRGDTQ